MIEYVKEYCIKNKIEYKNIILHGSRAVNLQNENSDHDYLIIIEKPLNFYIDTFKVGNEKLQLEFLDIEKAEYILANYEDSLMNRISDLNLLAGRAFMSRRLISNDNSFEILINKYKPYKKKSILLKKFIFQTQNFRIDSQTTDNILRAYSISKLAESLGVAILIHNDISWLNIKWQHKFLKNIFSKIEFEHYIKLRFNNENIKDFDVENFIKSSVKNINYKV